MNMYTTLTQLRDNTLKKPTSKTTSRLTSFVRIRMHGGVKDEHMNWYSLATACLHLLGIIILFIFQVYIGQEPKTKNSNSNIIRYSVFDTQDFPFPAFPPVAADFCTYNALYSAAVERLFSAAEQLLSARNCQMSVKSFNQSILCATVMKYSSKLDFSIMLLKMCWRTWNLIPLLNDLTSIKLVISWSLTTRLKIS